MPPDAAKGAAKPVAGRSIHFPADIAADKCSRSRRLWVRHSCPSRFRLRDGHDGRILAAMSRLVLLFRFAGYYGAVFLALGIYLPFWPVWLSAHWPHIRQSNRAPLTCRSTTATGFCSRL